ncbi:sugar ABC transporter ATP-binding protein [Oscillospiraceae bacterium MB08-C2-2]|nr:sugar ABC transporter ATP-binding protein [Oscillospiraceae bacterium MB08-C2-2]
MNGISKNFPAVKALDDVTLRVRPGTVHALMGENGAGKSTLMKCLFGIYTKDSGTIILDGHEVNFVSSGEALQGGLTMIHQELQPEPFLTVKENIWLGRLPTFGIGPIRFVDQKKMYADSLAFLKELDMDIDPNRLAGDLSVSQLQAIEIVKAVTYHSKVIIMDEPTSSLTEHEVETLFKIIGELRSQGVSIIYISHKMEEILRISDEVSIMRDGSMVGTWPASELTTDLIISRMVGRDLKNRFPPRLNKVEEDVVLSVSDYTSPFPHSFKNISFELKKGEILGIGGLVGAQRTELIEAVFGIRSLEKGSIQVDGKPVKITCPNDAMACGMALLTEERRKTGIFPVLSVQENIVISSLRQFCSKLGFIQDRRCKEAASDSTKRLSVKTPSLSTPISNLSGGNQQKALFARWLITEPDILLLDEPTRGIDVGSKYEIYTMMVDLASQGKSIIMISSETPELIGMSDRIMVMCEGKKAGELTGEEIGEEAIMRLATKYMVSQQNEGVAI